MVNVEFKTICKRNKSVYTEVFPFIGLSYSPETDETVLLLQGTRPRFACTGKEAHERLSASLRACLNTSGATLISIGGRWYNNKQDFMEQSQFADTAGYNEDMQYYATVTAC